MMAVCLLAALGLLSISPRANASLGYLFIPATNNGSPASSTLSFWGTDFVDSVRIAGFYLNSTLIVPTTIPSGREYIQNYINANTLNLGISIGDYFGFNTEKNSQALPSFGIYYNRIASADVQVSYLAAVPNTYNYTVYCSRNRVSTLCGSAAAAAPVGGMFTVSWSFAPDLTYPVEIDIESTYDDGNVQTTFTMQQPLSLPPDLVLSPSPRVLYGDIITAVLERADLWLPVSYTASFAGSLYSQTTNATGVTTWLFTAPNSSSGTLPVTAVNAGFTASNTVLVYAALPPSPTLSVTPAPTVYWSQVVVATVVGADTLQDITFSAFLDNVLYAQATSPSGGGTVWSFSGPTSDTGLLAITATNGPNTLTSTITARNPTVVNNGPSAVPLNTTVTFTVLGFSSQSPYAVTFGNGVYQRTTALPGSCTLVSVAVPPRYIGFFTATVIQSSTTSYLTYLVTAPSPVFHAYQTDYSAGWR